MRHIKQTVGRFIRGEEGATMVEYGLVIALLAMGSLVALGSLGTSVSDVFDMTATEFDSRIPGGGT